MAINGVYEQIFCLCLFVSVLLRTDSHSHQREKREEKEGEEKGKEGQKRIEGGKEGKA